MKNGTLLLHVAGDIHDPAGIPELRDSLALDIVDGLNVGISVVGADCRVIFTNVVADRVLSADEALTISQGHLRTKDPRQRPRLARAVRDAAVGHADGRCRSGLLLLPRASDPPLSVLVLPPRSRTSGASSTRPIALLMFCDSSRPITMYQSVLAAAYELTPAESRLLAALLAGQSLSAYAKASGITMTTAKTHLARIFGKTGHRRQVDLVRAMLMTPIVQLAGAQAGDGHAD